VKRRILVVDDDDAAREAVAYSLQTMAGWDVVEAYCGAQAIESATRCHDAGDGRPRNAGQTKDRPRHQPHPNRVVDGESARGLRRLALPSPGCWYLAEAI
jgi:CheY-like chemotaxis protein